MVKHVKLKLKYTSICVNPFTRRLYTWFDTTGIISTKHTFVKDLTKVLRPLCLVIPPLLVFTFGNFERKLSMREVLVFVRRLSVKYF